MNIFSCMRLLALSSVVTGLERFLQSPPSWIRGQRLGLLANPASVDRHCVHARQRIATRLPNQLRALYSPQHGFFAEKQDNMKESAHLTDPLLGVPVFSLYGNTRKPDRDMLEPIDVLLVDLQDVGTRVYTFIYTMAYCMEAARQYQRKVVVLDRPNPIGGIEVEGNCLSEAYRSFVGRYPIPMRHGLTIGELARLFNEHFGIGCELEVIPMEGWERNLYFADTGLPWVAPSPNLPTPVSALVYPGQVIWEGTNISEGRGTTQPFEIFGAPFMDPWKILEDMKTVPLPGACLRPLAFEPTFNKHAGRCCHGFQIHITEPTTYQPYATSLRLLQAIYQRFEADFAWSSPPYEYEFYKQPIDLIFGNREIRQRIEQLEPVIDIIGSWENDVETFKAVRKAYQLYPST
jgi:uncharacterized protein YbbC (DUF1343 family)